MPQPYSVSLKNSLATALVVINKCLCSRSQFLFLPESISALVKLKSVSLKHPLKEKILTLLKVAPKGKPMIRIHYKKKPSNTITRENEALGLRDEES